MYRKRFAGSMATESKELMLVMVTLSARSALKVEHHQLEYDPPGDAVTTSSVKPMAFVNPCSLSAMTARNPITGMMRNCMATPVAIANLLRRCFFRFLTSTVAERPKIRKKSKMFDMAMLK